MPDFLDEINATTNKVIFSRYLKDLVFRNSPFLAHLRAKCLEPWTGGTLTQHPFLYNRMIGGPYATGANFDLTKRQTLSSFYFDIRKYYINITTFLEDVELYNTGPAAAVQRVQADMKTAVNTMNEKIAIDLWHHGQNITTGSVTDNRALFINGFSEAINDGITPSWDGQVFPTYGGQTRNSFIGGALNSVPYFCGTKASGAAGQITYNILEEKSQDATIGAREPDLGVCNKAVYAYIKERIQPNQRFMQEQDPYFGVSGMRMNSAMILKDDYAPSAVYGQTIDGQHSYLTSTFDTTGLSPDSRSNMQASVTYTVGEFFAWINTSTWMLRISNSRLFGFGFTGYKYAQDNTILAGQVLLGSTLYCLDPRLNKQLFGISS